MSNISNYALKKLTNAINVPIGDMSILKKIQPFLDMCERLGKINSQLIDESVIKIEINCLFKNKF